MLALVMGILSFIRGGWGVSVITLGVIVCFILAAVHVTSPRTGLIAFVSGAAAWLASYIITSHMTAV